MALLWIILFISLSGRLFGQQKSRIDQQQLKDKITGYWLG